MRGALLAAALLVLIGCSGAPGPGAQSSQSPDSSSSSPNASPKTSPSANPPPSGLGHASPVAVTCSSQIPAGSQLALVTLKNTGVVVRDITNISSPTTRCVIYGGAFHRFVDATHVSYIVSETNGQSALYVVDLRDSSDRLIRAWSNQGSLYWVYAWSPDGKTLSYLSSSADRVAWHLLSAAGDVELSQLGSIPGRGVDPNNDDAMVGFSADGKYVALELTYIGVPAQGAPFQVVRLSDHTVVYSRGDATMAAWAGSRATLYYRTIPAAGSADFSSVEAWDSANGAVPVSSGLTWIHPRASPDGQRIAFAETAGLGNHYSGYVRVSDGKAIRILSRSRTGAAFLNATLMWYAEEVLCSNVCGPGEPKLTGRTYIFDVVTGKESASIITALFDIWPHSV